MITQSPLSFDLFVSYADADREWVEGYLLEALAQARVHYHSSETFRLGAPLIEEFERAVRESKRILLVCTHAYFSQNSEQFISLLAQHYGLESGVWPVIPLLLDDVTLPPRLGVLVPLDMRKPEEWNRAIDRLCKEFQAAPPAQTVRPACPYPGMVAFGEQDAQYFYGRGAEIDEMIQRLRYHNFLAVIGPSGSGKSSLVFAGLLPALRKRSTLGDVDWVVRTMRPGAQPLVTLSDVVGVATVSEFNLEQGLTTQTGASRLLLVIDQFEELFNAGVAEADEFIQVLSTLLQNRTCSVVLTVRADYFQKLMNCGLWSEIRGHLFDVLPLDKSSLREAIDFPAHLVQVYIESALVERLVNGLVGQPGALPFLQEILRRLWEKLERRFLPLRAYDALVLPYKSLHGTELTGLQAALAQLADEMIAKLSPTKQRLARRILVRLVEYNEGRDPTRRQQVLSALRAVGDDEDAFTDTVNYLSNCRLITTDAHENAVVKVDLAHEAMINGWPKLNGWVTEWKEAELTRRRLEVKAQEWVRYERKGGLLDSTELNEVETWLQSDAGKEMGVSDVLHEYIGASHVAVNPGWHRWGTGLLLASGITYIAFILWLYVITRSMNGFVNGVIWLIALGSTLVATLFSGLLQSSLKFQGQKISHLLSGNRFAMTSALAAIVLVSGLWIVYGYRVFQTERHCASLYGNMPQANEIRLAIFQSVSLDKEPYYIQLMRNILSQYGSISSIIVSNEDLAQCNHFFTNSVAVGSETLPDQTQKITATLADSSIEVEHTTADTLSCELFARLAFRIANRVSSKIVVELSTEEMSQPTCAVFELNVEGFNAYYKAQYELDGGAPDYEQQQLRLLTFAESKLQQAIELSEQGFAIPYYNLGNVYLVRGYIEEFDKGQTDYYVQASEALSMAVKLLPRYVPFLVTLGNTCRIIKDWTCAEVNLKRAISIEPTYIRGSIRLAHLYVVTRRLDEAESLIVKIGQMLDKGNIEDRNLLLVDLQLVEGMLWFTKGEWHAVVNVLTKAESLAIEDPTGQSYAFLEEIAYYLGMSFAALVPTESHVQQDACNYLSQHLDYSYKRLPGEFERNKLTHTTIALLKCVENNS